ncbi:polysaccharide deacetylase family protein [Paenibacillus albus]|uniref:ChbG/HpnK family deacetylase n=1 Tax=Paenibacillus albus TaxID=2495582 RepID=A0A3S9A024_9BACL|nr:polysaccharide deacetylase family protein [Paenibacillus albus]AZN39088.1 ChbG/HpnK family deacetylase [Paenibacillus albus]
MKYLVINCDDFGQSPAMNAAIMHLLEERLVSSATLMAPAPGFEEAAAWCRKRGQTNIGLHLTLTSEFDALRWKSLTGDPSLHDEQGYMYQSVLEFERGANTKAVMKELDAQYELVRGYGIKITHADNHMGSLYGIAAGRSHIPQVLMRCARWKVPFRIFRRVHAGDVLATIEGVERAASKASALAGTLGVALPDYLLSHPFEIVEGETYESFKREIIAKLYHLPEGISETYIHPGLDDPAMMAAIPHWEKRVWEYRLMLDDDMHAAMKDAGVTLVDYRYIAAHGRESRFRAVRRLAAELLRRT